MPGSPPDDLWDAECRLVNRVLRFVYLTLVAAAVVLLGITAAVIAVRWPQ